MAENVFVFDHPLIQHKITLLRDKNTGTKEFRELVAEIAMLMAYEVTRDLPLKDVEVQTPITTARSKMLAGKNLAIVPILRAGLGMVDGMVVEPHTYYCKLPEDINERNVIVLDPMLATGGSASAAIGYLKEQGINNIKFMCLIASPEGIARLSADHPDVHIYCAAKDEGLNENSYIVPGLGDAGDRIFGTE